jgi:hypothetical protein
MQNQTISFTKEETEQALNLAFGNRFSSNDINTNDADDYQARPTYSNGIYSFTYGEAVFSRLRFLSSPDETTFIYQYRFESVAYDMDETGSVTVTIETSSDNPHGFSIKSLQVSPSETSGADTSTRATSILADAITNLPQDDAVNTIWDLLDGYWNTEDNYFAQFTHNEYMHSLLIGKWESSGGIGYGEIIGAERISTYEIFFTVRYPATEANEVSDAREESTAIIFIDMGNFEHDGTFNMELINHDGISHLYTFLYGGKTGEEAYMSFLFGNDNLLPQMAGTWRMDWPNPDNAVIMILGLNGSWESPGALPTDHTQGGSFTFVSEEAGIYRLRLTIEHSTSPYTEIGSEIDGYMYDAQNDVLFIVMSSGEGDSIVKFIREPIASIG